MILAVTGTPGSGKTFRLVCEIADHLQKGGWVATNVPLKPGWEERLARRNLLTRFYRPSRRERILGNRYFYSDDPDELLRVVLPEPRRGQPWEGRGLWVLDEAHENLNSRTWADENRLKVVKWLSRSRHRGWDVRLGTQHFDSLDKQLRDRCEYEELIRNLKRAQIAGIPVVPVNLFLAIRVWRGGPTQKRLVAKRSLYMLDDRKRLYDTHGLRALAADELAGSEAIYFGDDPRGSVLTQGPPGLPPDGNGREADGRPDSPALLLELEALRRPARPAVSDPMTSERPAPNGPPANTSDLNPAGRGRFKQ